MHNRLLTAWMPQSPRSRAIVILFFSAGLVGGLGCATAMVVSGGNSNAPAHYGKPVYTDTVYALARPDAVLAKRIGSENAIAFIGKKNTYLVVEGGETLTRVARELDGDRVTLEQKPGQLFIKDKTAWGSLHLRYSPRSGADDEKLHALGFKSDRSGVYRLSVAVKAAVYPPVSVRADQSEQFKQSRELAFYNPPDSSPPPDLGLLIKLPVAIAVDVATAPIQVFGFGMLLLVAAGSSH